MANKNLAHTQINKLLRVSTAVIQYPVQDWGSDYCQYETYIFSDDPRIRTKQIIHGTSHEDNDEELTKVSIKKHKGISEELLSKFSLLPE